MKRLYYLLFIGFTLFVISGCSHNNNKILEKNSIEESNIFESIISSEISNLNSEESKFLESSKLLDSKEITTSKSQESSQATVTSKPISSLYVLNTNTKKIHNSNCQYVKKIKPENYSPTNNFQEAISQGYKPCKVCKPIG